MELNKENELAEQITQPPETALSFSSALTLAQDIAAATPSELESLEGKIAAIKSRGVRALNIKALATRLKIPAKLIESDVNAIQQMLQYGTGNTAPTINTTVGANFPELVDIAMDESGSVVFLTANMLIGEMYMHNKWYDGETEISPPTVKQVPYLLPRAEAVIKHYMNDNDEVLFQDVTKYLNRFCYITPGQALIVTCYVFLTYLQDRPEIHYLAIITLVGDPERGKSRLGKSIAFVSHRGVALNGIKEAHIIRLAEDFLATLFIDLRAAWKKVVAEKVDDLILGRYERGHQVMRVIAPDKGAFADSRFFRAYGATIIASNEALENVLETRCIPLTMENRPNDYEIPQEILGQELRERLVAWRARVLHEPLPAIEPIGLSGRFWDISQPILRICKLLHEGGYQDLCKELLDMAAEKVEMKKDTIEGFIIQSIGALSAISAGDCNLQLDVLLQGLNIGMSPDETYSSQFLGLKLKSMGIKTKHVRGHSWLVLEKKQFDVLMQQYGLSLAVEQPSVITDLMNNVGLDT